MGKKKLLSIIIPYYNTENFEFTMNNLIANTSDELEIIIVNDQSSIEYSQKLLKYKRKNLKIINHVKNLGLATARKTGFNNSVGKYVFFLDAGDKLYVETLLGVIRNNDGIDIITFNFKMRSSKLKQVITKGNSFIEISKSYAGVWIRTYKKKLIRETDFLNAKWFGEDVYFTLKVAQRASTFKKIEEVIYMYNNYDYGMTRETNDDWLTIINTMNKLIDESRNSDEKKIFKTRKLFQLLAYLYRMKSLNNKKNIYLKFYAELIHTKGFWHLEFKVKLFYLFVRSHLYWIIYKSK